jgi:N-acetylgalactosamine-6-sulfatase
VPAGRIDNDSVLAAVDFLPTVCSLAGVKVPADVQLDGEDTSDILLGKSRPRTKPILWEWLFRVWGDEYWAPMLAIREGKWKLLTNPDGSRTELYDIPADPAEKTDLAAANPDVVKRLSEKVLAWQKTLPPHPQRAVGRPGNQ